MPVIHAPRLTITYADSADLSVVEEPDAALLTHALADRAAFAPLYARYADRIYWYCYLRLGTRELAEDATSLTFTKALTSLPSCQPDRFRAWLFQHPVLPPGNLLLSDDGSRLVMLHVGNHPVTPRHPTS